MHFGDLVQGRGAAGADRPDRLVGDDEPVRGGVAGDRAGELRADAAEGLAGVALGLGLADADDGEEAGPPGRGGLARDERVVSPWSAAALGMADDHRDRAGVRQHLGGDVAGMGAGGLRVTVLAAEREAAAGEPGDQRGRRADQHVAAGRMARRRARRATAAEAARPFIFQFPATSLRRPSAAPPSRIESRSLLAEAPRGRKRPKGRAGSRVERAAGPVAGGFRVVERRLGQGPVVQSGGACRRARR